MWLCVQYTLFMIANVCVSTELLFSLVGLLGLVPLRVLLPSLHWKITRRNRETRWLSYNTSKPMSTQKLVYLDVFAPASRRSDFTEEGKICPVKHTSRQKRFHVLTSTYAEIRSDFEYKHVDDTKHSVTCIYLIRWH